MKMSSLARAFFDLVGAQAPRANTHPLGRSVYVDLDALDIRLRLSFRLDVGMAHQITGHRAFAADIALI